MARFLAAGEVWPSLRSRLLSLRLVFSAHLPVDGSAEGMKLEWRDGEMKEGWGSLFACGRWTGRWCALRLQSAALDRLAALQLSDSARISRVKYKGEASLLPERPAANQKWRVEKSWNVEGNKRRRCFISLDRGRRNERAGGNATNQIQSCGNEGTCDVRYTRTPPSAQPPCTSRCHGMCS